MQKRNEDGENKMMQFNQEGDEQQKGKARRQRSKALLQADYQDYYPFDANVPLVASSQTYREYRSEEVDQYNNFCEASLNQDAQRFFKEQDKLEDKKGLVTDNVITKHKVDQNFLSKALTEGGLT